MKKSFLIILFIALSFSLNAGIYKSNALSQGLDIEDELLSVGWELSKDNDKEILYLDGNIESTKNYLSDGYEITKSNYYERVFVDSAGNIIRKLIEDNGITKEYNYFYSGNKLTSYTYSENNELIKKVDYLKVGKDLVAISGTTRVFFLSEYYTYNSADGAYTINIPKEFEDVKPVSEYTTLDSGILEEKRDGIIYHYNQLGRLIEEIGEDYKLDYFYSDSGDLERIERTIGDRKEIEYYSQSMLSKTAYYENGTMTKERRVLSSGDIEEIRYISGIARYRLLFYPNGKRLKEVVAL